MQKISQKLSDCVNYIHAVHFHGFEESAKSGKYYHMSSFGESKVIKETGGGIILFFASMCKKNRPAVYGYLY